MLTSDLIKEIIKAGICIIVGIIAAALFPLSQLGGWVYLLYPLYLIGIVYGFGMILPWLGNVLGSISRMFMFSVIMKSLLGIIGILVIFPVALAGTLTVGSVAGLVKFITRFFQLISEAVQHGAPKRDLIKGEREWEKNEQGKESVPVDDSRPRTGRRSGSGNWPYGNRGSSSRNSGSSGRNNNLY